MRIYPTLSWKPERIFFIRLIGTAHSWQNISLGPIMNGIVYDSKIKKLLSSSKLKATRIHFVSRTCKSLPKGETFWEFVMVNQCICHGLQNGRRYMKTWCWSLGYKWLADVKMCFPIKSKTKCQTAWQEGAKHLPEDNEDKISSNNLNIPETSFLHANNSLFHILLFFLCELLSPRFNT